MVLGGWRCRSQERLECRTPGRVGRHACAIRRGGLILWVSRVCVHYCVCVYVWSAAVSQLLRRSLAWPKRRRFFGVQQQRERIFQAESYLITGGARKGKTETHGGRRSVVSVCVKHPGRTGGRWRWEVRASHIHRAALIFWIGSVAGVKTGRAPRLIKGARTSRY